MLENIAELPVRFSGLKPPSANPPALGAAPPTADALAPPPRHTPPDRYAFCGGGGAMIPYDEPRGVPGRRGRPCEELGTRHQPAGEGFGVNEARRQLDVPLAATAPALTHSAARVRLILCGAAPLKGVGRAAVVVLALEGAA